MLTINADSFNRPPHKNYHLVVDWLRFFCPIRHHYQWWWIGHHFVTFRPMYIVYSVYTKVVLI